MNYLRHIPKSISKLHSKIIPISSNGSWITDINNKKYLDLTSGIGALSTGHNHPKVIEKVKKQLDNYVHIPQQVFATHPIQMELNKKLYDIMPCKELDTFFYVNSGSEATDNAIKISRKYTRKTNVITMNRGFHGRTLGALSFTSSNTACKEKMQPLIPGGFFCNDFTKESLDLILQYQSSPDETAAIFLEPILGEGGVHSIPADFLKYVREVCDAYKIIFIADEVQCGAGRTGTWWNIEQKDVVPDMITFAKGIASGFPLAGIATKSKIIDNIGTGNLGGTYGGNAMASAAACASIDVINNENLLKNATKMGLLIKNNLKDELLIKEIRQHGLMIAIEFNKDISHSLVSSLRDDGILVLMSGNKNQYIRLLPPLNIKEQEVNYFIDIFKKNIKIFL
jgi:4-aminobutyrate aminotransferase